VIKFIVDTQLPPRLAKFLQEKGFDAIHTTFFPEGHLLKDLEIVKIAIDENRIIISKDNDFLDNFLLKGTPPRVLLLQFGNLPNGELLELFDINLSNLVHFLKRGADFLFFSRDQIIEY